MKTKFSTICSASLALILAAPVFAADSERAQATTDRNETNIRTNTATPETGGTGMSTHSGHAAHGSSQHSDQQAAAQGDVEPIETKEFFETASAKGMAEIETSKIALEKATNPEVRQFAERMIEEHKTSHQKLEQLAKQQGVKPSKEPKMMDKAKAQILEMRDGESFDEAYINNQVVAHEQTVELFERAAQSDDQSVRSFAQQSLPMLRDHLQEVKDLQEKLSDSVAQAN